MTALLGVAGSFLASYAGQALGWYGQGEVAVVVPAHSVQLFAAAGAGLQ